MRNLFEITAVILYWPLESCFGEKTKEGILKFVCMLPKSEESADTAVMKTF